MCFKAYGILLLQIRSRNTFGTFFRLQVFLVCYRTVRLPRSIHKVRLHNIRPILRVGLHDFDTVLIKYMAASLTRVFFIDFNTFCTISQDWWFIAFRFLTFFAFLVFPICSVLVIPTNLIILDLITVFWQEYKLWRSKYSIFFILQLLFLSYLRIFLA
jgi:hypothetical protein